MSQAGVTHLFLLCLADQTGFHTLYTFLDDFRQDTHDTLRLLSSHAVLFELFHK